MNNLVKYTCPDCPQWAEAPEGSKLSHECTAKNAYGRRRSLLPPKKGKTKK